MRPSAPPRWACRSTRSHSAPRTAPSKSATSTASSTRCPVPPDTATLQQIADTTGGKAFDAPTAEDLASVYDNLKSSIGYTQETQEVTFALVGAGLLLVIVGAGLSAVWFGRLP